MTKHAKKQIKNRHVSTRVNDDLLNKIKEYCKHYEITISEFIKYCLEKELSEYHYDKKILEPLKTYWKNPKTEGE